MSILKDILDTVRDIDAAGTMDEYFRKKKYSSISKRSMEGTLQFPVLVSRSLDIQTLQMITKALERQYSTFTQVAITMSPFLRVDADKDPAGFLRQFHQNTDVKSDLMDVMNFGVDVLKDNYTLYVSENGTKAVIAGIYDGATGKVIAENKELLGSVLEHVRFDNLNDKFIPTGGTLYKFANENLSKYHNSIVTEAKGGKGGGSPRPITNNNTDRSTNLNNMMSNNIISTTVNQYETKAAENKRFAPSQMDVRLADKVLTDNDVKKSNELVPTTLHIRVKILGPDKTDGGYLDFIIGVKATMHPINSDEMVTNIINGCKSNNKFFDFIRWTSGEISFFKDFVFNIKEIKDDVVNRSAGSSPWWITLKRRRALAKIKSAIMLPTQILPNASIVLSMEEVEYIKTNYGYDLMNPDFVDKVMQTYFLLGFVVVDNSTQIAHFMFDGKNNFESVTFNGLEKENSNDKTFKEMLKLVNRY